MVTEARSSSGQPLLALLLLILCWTSMRIAVGGSLPISRTPSTAEGLSSIASRNQGAQMSGPRPALRLDEEAPDLDEPNGSALISRRSQSARRMIPESASRDVEIFHVSGGAGAASAVGVKSSDEPLSNPMGTTTPYPAPTGPEPALARHSHTARRWSADAWVFLREGRSRLAASGLTVPTYGASQAGAVLRYRLAPRSALQPAAYARVASALGAARESDLAAGVSLRPVPGVPVSAAGELRLSLREGRRELRPAAFLAAGFDDARMPHGLRARGYAQAGYVGGRYATGFADGNLVAERPLAQAFSRGVHAGAGMWGGVQRGSGRLDIGPSASLPLRLGDTGARLSADYRFRVAGNAEPSRSAALTLTAGF